MTSVCVKYLKDVPNTYFMYVNPSHNVKTRSTTTSMLIYSIQDLPIQEALAITIK